MRKNSSSRLSTGGHPSFKEHKKAPKHFFTDKILSKIKPHKGISKTASALQQINSQVVPTELPATLKGGPSAPKGRKRYLDYFGTVGKQSTAILPDVDEEREDSSRMISPNSSRKRQSAERSYRSRSNHPHKSIMTEIHSRIESKRASDRQRKSSRDVMPKQNP
jgi:hypothetical protein